MTMIFKTILWTDGMVVKYLEIVYSNLFLFCNTKNIIKQFLINVIYKNSIWFLYIIQDRPYY